MKVYSPHQTADWLKCPQYRMLRRKWQLNRPVSKLDLASGLGRAIADGVDTINKSLIDGFEFSSARADDAVILGLAASDRARLAAEQTVLGLQEDVIPEDLQDYVRDLPTLAANGTAGYISQLPNIIDYQVLLSEYELPSRSRLDMGVRHHASQRLEVIDLKTKLTITPKQLSSYEQLYGTTGLGSQLYHYCYEWGQICQKQIRDYRIHLLVVLPTPKLYEFRYHIPEERFQTWRQSMCRIWDDMELEEAGMLLPYQRRESCSTMWGKCEFHPVCHEYYYDETLTSLKYTKIEREASE